MTTKGGIAGIGLGHQLWRERESMIQLPKVEWRLLACFNGASPGCIIVVAAAALVGCWLLVVDCWLLVVGMTPCASHATSENVAKLTQ